MGARAGLSAAAAALALTACGGTGHAGAPALFARDCGVCHSISGHASARQQGGDLRGLRLPAAEISQYIAEMPRLHGPLSDAQVQLLTGYLVSLERRR